jgi:hypothetical protein
METAYDLVLLRHTGDGRCGAGTDIPGSHKMTPPVTNGAISFERFAGGSQ